MNTHTDDAEREGVCPIHRREYVPQKRVCPTEESMSKGRDILKSVGHTLYQKEARNRETRYRERHTTKRHSGESMSHRREYVPSTERDTQQRGTLERVASHTQIRTLTLTLTLTLATHRYAP